MIFDRSESHMISWQNLDYSKGNLVEYYILPPKPQIISTKNDDGSLIFSVEDLSAESGFTLSIYSKEKKEYQELFKKIGIDAFPGEKIQDSIKIVITPEFTTDRNSYYENQGASDQVLETLSANCEIKQFLNGLLNSGSKALQTDVQTGSIQLKIVNQTGSKLPVTGSSMTLILLAGGSLLMIAGLYNLRKQKNEKLD